MTASAHRPESAPEDLSAFDLLAGPAERVLVFAHGQPVRADAFLSQVLGLAARLPPCSALLNLCERRDRFLVTFCAGLVRGLPTLLPPSRAPGVIDEMLERWPDALPVGDDGLPGGTRLDRRPPRYWTLPDPLPRGDGPMPRIPANQLAAIGFTSGSSGPPKAQPKTWGGFCRVTGRNAALLAGIAGGPAQLLATVPSQHMYGMELSVLLPLRGGFGLHIDRPFFPADIAAALEALPEPRVLVTTPVHLRALVASGQPLPPLTAIVSATAPLGRELAQAAEAATGARVVEVFGSTETCVIAHRRAAREDAWTPYDGVRLVPRPDGALVEAGWLPEPVLLQDVIEPLPDGRFRLAGRASDHLEIAGKRASLGELTRRLLAIEGVRDGVVFQPDSDGPVHRVAALVVAPALDEAAILAALRDAVDPVFLPRPLRRVEALPRNDTGKLPRSALLAALRAG